MDTAYTPDKYVIFEEEVKGNFYFLEQQYDFRISQVKQSGFTKIIRYESTVVYVNLIYGPPAYEPEMSFGRIGIDEIPETYCFDHGDLILLKNCANWKWNPDYPNHFVGLISEFARILKGCGSACLKGDQAVFEEMSARRNSFVKGWNQQEKADRIRKDAHLAWVKRDYGTVINKYEEIKDMLTETEKMRYDYAKKCTNR